MKYIQQAVAAYLEQATGIRTVCDRTRVRGTYPMLAVGIEEKGTVLLSGGRLAEHTYQVTITAVSDRDRDGNTALLSDLPVWLLRGVPMETEDGLRILHPLHIATEGEELTFTLEVCVCVPPLTTHGEEATETMDTLHFGVSR